MTDTTNTPATEAEAVTQLAMAAAGVVPVEVLDLGGRHHVFSTRTDMNGRQSVEHETIIPVDDHGNRTAKPLRIVQGVTVETEASLIDYVRDFKTAGSRMFAAISTNTIVAVLDFHEGRTTATLDMMNDDEKTNVTDPAANPDFGGAPDFGQHTATLKLPYSEEWGVWTLASGSMKSQVDFARFIQENAPDISDPQAADVLDVVRDLRGSRQVKFTGVVNMNSNNDSFEYEDKTHVGAKDTLEIPDAFTLSIPVFFGGPKVKVQAQLRHEVNDEGRLKLGVKLLRAESIRQAAFMDVVENAGSESGVPVVYGVRRGGE